MNVRSILKFSRDLSCLFGPDGAIIEAGETLSGGFSIKGKDWIGCSVNTPELLAGDLSLPFDANTHFPVQGTSIPQTGPLKGFQLEWNILPDQAGNFLWQAAYKAPEGKTLPAYMLQAILEYANFSIITTDTEGVVRSMNRKAEQILGYDRSEVIGLKTPEIFHDANEVIRRASELSIELGRPVEPGFDTFVAKAILKGVPDENEWTYIRKNGTRFPVQLSVTALKDEKGDLLGLMGIAKDLSEIKEARDSVQQSRQQIRQFLAALPIGVYVLKADGQALYANQKSIEILGRGISPDATADTIGEIYEAVKAGTNEPYPPDQMPVVRGLSGEESYIQDMEIHRNGQKIPLEVWGRPIRDKSGKITYSIAAFIDISERKAFERKQEHLMQDLRRLNSELELFSKNLKQLHQTLTQETESSEELFEEILKTGLEVFGLPIGNLSRIEGSDYEIIASVSPEGELKPGTRFDLANTYCEQVYREKRTIAYEEFGADASNCGHPAYKKFKLEAYIGAPVWVGGEVMGTLSFSSPDPRPDGFNRQEKEFLELLSRAISFRIQEDLNLKRLEKSARDLRESNDELQRINKELDQFAYIVSHDLKAPLRAINNLSAWLEEDAAQHLSGESLEHLKLLRNRVERMESLINGILEYSRAGRNKGTGNWIRIPEIIREVKEIVDLPENFRIEIQEDFPRVWGYKREIYQIMVNLISNAIKYHDRENGMVRVSWKPKGNWLEVSVEDDGPGIPEKHHDRIFGVFNRLEGRDQIEGTGIGLAIVKKIVESNGGYILVENREGRGVRFIFSLPMKKPN